LTGDAPAAMPLPTESGTNTEDPQVGFDPAISVFKRYKTACPASGYRNDGL
jgi:hypothetical protein